MLDTAREEELSGEIRENWENSKDSDGTCPPGAACALISTVLLRFMGPIVVKAAKMALTWATCKWFGWWCDDRRRLAASESVTRVRA